MMNFCTLFDSNYLDKGICLYNSLSRVSTDFTLFIFCFDEKSKEILCEMKLSNVVLLSNKDIEDEELLRLKAKRSKAEYCWTCTPRIIEYVLDNYNVDDCTYIDADLYFYNNPQVLFDEIKLNKANVAIAPHNFPKNNKSKRQASRYGKYCVQFNYFDQTENGRRVLKWWKEKCTEWCFCSVEPGRYGDQKYLDRFSELFDGVHVISNLGCGVAPWNLMQYEILDGDDSYKLKVLDTDESFDIIFYHFQHLRFLEDGKVNLHSGTDSVKTKNKIYFPYLKETIKIRENLAKKGVYFSNKIAHSSSILRRIYQLFIAPFLHKRKTDIVDMSTFKD